MRIGNVWGHKSDIVTIRVERGLVGPCICETEKEPVVTPESTIKMGAEGI